MPLHPRSRSNCTDDHRKCKQLSEHNFGLQHYFIARCRYLYMDCNRCCNDQWWWHNADNYIDISERELPRRMDKRNTECIWIYELRIRRSYNCLLYTSPS